MRGNKTMTTTTKQTPHSRMTDRVRQRLPASTIVDSTRLARERLPIRLCTAADPATHDRLSEYTRWQSQASTVANLSTRRHRFDRHSDKTRLARWRNNQTQQQNGKTWPSIRPRMARIERGRPPIGLHTMAKPSKRVHSAGRQNHKVDQKQSQTDHATADPSTHSRQRYRRTRPQPQTQVKNVFACKNHAYRRRAIRHAAKQKSQNRQKCRTKGEPSRKIKLDRKNLCKNQAFVTANAKNIAVPT